MDETLEDVLHDTEYPLVWFVIDYQTQELSPLFASYFQSLSPYLFLYDRGMYSIHIR